MNALLAHLFDSSCVIGILDTTTVLVEISYE